MLLFLGQVVAELLHGFQSRNICEEMSTAAPGPASSISAPNMIVRVFFIHKASTLKELGGLVL